jgi:hypothetical protein
VRIKEIRIAKPSLASHAPKVNKIKQEWVSKLKDIELPRRRIKRFNVIASKLNNVLSKCLC